MDKPAVPFSSYKPPTSSANTEIDKLQCGCELAYNKYLQARLKRLLVTKRITDRKQAIEQQFQVRNCALDKQYALRDEYVNKIDETNRKLEIVKSLECLSPEIDNKFQMVDTAIDTVYNKLSKSVNNELTLQNIKPITSQEEMDKLLNAIQKCVTSLLKIDNSQRDFQDIHLLGENIQKLKEVEQILLQKAYNLTDIQRKNVHKLLASMSDAFVNLRAHEDN